jgi:hypothetical protein
MKTTDVSATAEIAVLFWDYRLKLYSFRYFGQTLPIGAVPLTWEPHHANLAAIAARGGKPPELRWKQRVSEGYSHPLFRYFPFRWGGTRESYDRL